MHIELMNIRIRSINQSRTSRLVLVLQNTQITVS